MRDFYDRCQKRFEEGRSKLSIDWNGAVLDLKKGMTYSQLLVDLAHYEGGEWGENKFNGLSFTEIHPGAIEGFLEVTNPKFDPHHFLSGYNAARLLEGLVNIDEPLSLKSFNDAFEYAGGSRWDADEAVKFLHETWIYGEKIDRILKL